MDTFFNIKDRKPTKLEAIRLFYMPICPEQDWCSCYSKNIIAEAYQYILSVVIDEKIDTIMNIIESNYSRINEINASNIPQFSSFSNLDTVLNIVNTNDKCDFSLIGYYFNKDSKVGAQRKYGENHYKLAAQLGLALPDGALSVSLLGQAYLSLDDSIKPQVLNKLILRIPIIQYLGVKLKYTNVDIVKELDNYLSHSTAIRRSSNIKYLLHLVFSDVEFSF